MSRIFLAATLTLALLGGCSDAGKQPVLGIDGDLPAEVAQGDLRSTPDLPDTLVEEDLSAPDTAQADLPDDLTPVEDVPLPDLATPDLAPEIVEPDLPVEETVEPEVVTVDTVIPPGPACGDIFKCGISKGCGDLDPACWESCAGEAEPEALAAFADLATCVEDQCSQLPEEQQGDCLMSLCLEEVFACVGGEGDADCRATLKCIQTCPEDDGVCFFDCIAASNEESLALILDMANATQMEGFALMVECIGGKGDFSCGQAVSCFTNCEGTEPGGPGEDPTVDCMMDCIEETSPEGADDLLAFLGCVEEKCPEGMEECPGVFLCMDKCPGLGF